jgi:flagellar biosynthesis anti-sigma factor FlgM
MRIATEFTSGPGRVSSKKDIAPASLSKNGSASGAGDVVSVSSAAHLFAAAKEGLAEVPAVRSSIIEAIKSKLDSGTYSPDNGAVADAIMREHFQPGIS